MSMNAVSATITISPAVSDELDALARELGVSREEALSTAVKRQLDRERTWNRAREELRHAAARAGLRNEDDLEDFMDSLDDPDI